MLLADRKATLDDLHSTKEILNILEDAKKEFPGCCEPNHYIPLSEEMKKWAKENRPDFCPCHEWFKKWFGENRRV